jgi:hypothetical protein
MRPGPHRREGPDACQGRLPFPRRPEGLSAGLARAATAQSNGRSPGSAATASSTPTATRFPPPRAAPTRQDSATFSPAACVPMPSSRATSAPRWSLRKT